MCLGSVTHLPKTQTPNWTRPYAGGDAASPLQRYYNRGSQANWEAMKAEEAEALSTVGETAGYAMLATALPCRPCA